MKYRAKCNKCGREFNIEAQGGQRVKCGCPYCGKEVTVLLPDVQKKSDKRRSGGNGMKVFLVTLFVVIVGLAAGVTLWYVYQQNKNSVMLAEKLKEANRKAHRDSLMSIRNAQDNRRHEAEELEIREKSIGNFIKTFYLDAIFGDNSPEIYKASLTPGCLERLAEKLHSHHDDHADETIWHLFAPMGKEHDLPCLRKHLSVSHYMDNWYKVRLVDNGQTEYRYIRALIVDGNVKIDDVR